MTDLLIPVKTCELQPGFFKLPERLTLASSHSIDRLPLKQLRDDLKQMKVAGRVTLDAVYPCARDHLSFPELLAEGLEPHKVQEVWFWGADRKNHVVDITETFALKTAALACHESQLQGHKAGDMEAWLRKVGEEKAGGKPFDLGEGFHREIMPP